MSETIRTDGSGVMDAESRVFSMNDNISRKAAIQKIKDLPDCPNGYSDTYDKEQIIGILEELSSAHPEGDMISRQAVNGIIDALFQNKNHPLIASPNVLYAFRQIQNLPSVNTHNALEVPSSNTHNALEALEMRWIPCSERLPDKDGEYLVAYEYRYKEDYGFSDIGIAPFEVDCEGFGIWQERFDHYTLGSLGSDFVRIDVIAWQPLPEPYKAEE